MNQLQTKLTSRKFWTAVAGFVTPLLVAFGMSEESAVKVSAIIMSCASFIAYMVSEGMVDASRVKSETKTTSTITTTTIKEVPMAPVEEPKTEEPIGTDMESM